MSELFRSEVFDERANRVFGEVVITQPPSVRILGGALLTICALTAAWIGVGSYSRIESAPGFLVTDKPSPRIVAPQAGIISSLKVREGSVVQVGETLAVVTVDRSTEAGTGTAVEGVNAIDARLEIGRDQIRNSDLKRQSERNRLMSIIASSQAQAEAFDGQISLQREVVNSSGTLFQQIGPVMQKGYVSRFEYERRRQTLLAAKQALGTLEQQRLMQLAQVNQARAQLMGLNSDAARETNDIRSSIELLRQQRAELEGQRSYIIRAPITGRVTALQTTLGNTAMPGSTLFSIVPLDARVKAEIYAPSRAIGFVHPGQKTRLLYDAFPYQRFGSFGGTIASVSRIVIDPRDSSIPIKLEEPVYKVSVILDDQTINVFGQRLALQPGMTLRANVILERRSFIDWLLAPIRAVRNRT